MEINKSTTNINETIQKIKNFLELQIFSYNSDIPIQDNIKIMCVQKLCEVVGIKCKCNYKNKFFNYFSSITGEAVCNILNIPITIASDNFRLFKYNGINFIDHVKEILENDDLENAFTNIFEFLDNNKGVINIE